MRPITPPRPFFVNVSHQPQTEYPDSSIPVLAEPYPLHLWSLSKTVPVAICGLREAQVAVPPHFSLNRGLWGNCGGLEAFWGVIHWESVGRYECWDWLGGTWQGVRNSETGLLDVTRRASRRAREPQWFISRTKFANMQVIIPWSDREIPASQSELAAPVVKPDPATLPPDVLRPFKGPGSRLRNELHARDVLRAPKPENVWDVAEEMGLPGPHTIPRLPANIPLYHGHENASALPCPIARFPLSYVSLMEIPDCVYKLHMGVWIDDCLFGVVCASEDVGGGCGLYRVWCHDGTAWHLSYNPTEGGSISRRTLKPRWLLPEYYWTMELTDQIGRGKEPYPYGKSLAHNAIGS